MNKPKVSITGEGKFWNWKLEYEGKSYGQGHNYYGQTMESLEKTAEREWGRSLSLFEKFKKMEKL